MGWKRSLGLGITLFVLSACAAKPTTNAFEYMVSGTLFAQKAAENAALQYQAFQVAKMVLDQDLKYKQKGRRAIIVDIDETVLDNSPFQARVIKTGESYPTGWVEWVRKAEAKPIPGAVAFMNYAHDKGVKVFYLSNRKIAQLAPTMDNLKATGFPDVTEETLLLRTTESSKEARRAHVRNNYRVVLMAGDNLNDFTDEFGKHGADARLAAAHGSADAFGTRFIVLPNVMYGDWESSIYNFNHSLTEVEKDQARKAALQDFELPVTAD